MEWKELDLTTKNVLERCWGLYDDHPRSFSVEIGMNLYEQPVTWETYEQITKYQEHFPHFEVKLEGERITVSGKDHFGSWLKNKNEITN